MENILISVMLVDVEGYTFPSANAREPVLYYSIVMANMVRALFIVNSIMVNLEMRFKAEIRS